MSRTLTASDRKSLIRLASTLPSGSAERKAILAGLKKSASSKVAAMSSGVLADNLARLFMGDIRSAVRALSKFEGSSIVSSDPATYNRDFDGVSSDFYKVIRKWFPDLD